MFEGKPPRPRDARAFDEEQHDFETLRPLNWGDLVARFSAAHEMRSSCDEADESGALHNGKHDVNPDISGNGKSPAGTDLRAADGAEPRAMRK